MSFVSTTFCQETGAKGLSGKSVWLLEAKGRAEVLRVDRRQAARPREPLLAGDRLQTWANSHANLLWYGSVAFQVSELSELVIPPPPGVEKRSTLELIKGFLYFFHRGPPRTIEIKTPTAVATIIGTEFSVRVAEDGATDLMLFDGRVELDSPHGHAEMNSGQQARIEPGRPPVVTPILAGVNDLIQWFLYYPGMLNVDELALTPNEEQDLAASLAAYRTGDLRVALSAYPADRLPRSGMEVIYRAALLLAVGQVVKAEALLGPAGLEPAGERAVKLAAALRKLVAAVKGRVDSTALDRKLATASMAESYYQQSHGNLAGSLAAARQAVAIAPEFGFGWARVAELEFSFGRTQASLAAVERAVRISPHHAEAIALRGFLLAARGEVAEALDQFARAIAQDGGLGNAWLGRGLGRIQQGQLESGREDLLIAAAVEPQRSLLRSYLAKAWSQSGHDALATQELERAKKLDPRDPTPWLYSSLLNQAGHRINPAVVDLEESMDRNENRQVYRSRFLLDQDRSVRGASLAAVYQAAGMPEVSTREAARAVGSDYANYSAHLFLANSLDSLRDPTRFNLRYETAWFNELLLANLLAPVDAGVFAQSISQQEYSRMFDTKRFGLTTTTEVRSDGEYREVASHSGRAGNFGYSLDLDYQHNNGLRPNNGLDRLEWYSQFKYQLTPSDMLFLLLKYQDYHSGDNFQYYDWRQGVRTNFTFDEFQHPIVVGGYHREWAPGVHTLLLGGRLVNDQRFHDRAVPGLVLVAVSNTITSAGSLPFDARYRSQFEANTAELNQILQSDRHTVILGGRLQSGEVATRNELNVANPAFTNFFLTPAALTNVTDDFQRTTAYAYYTFEPIERLHLTAGLSYDWVRFPGNHRHAPISSSEVDRELLGPKAAVVFAPVDWITFRGSYSRSLGGVTLDQSYRLEPTQLAGFVQTFRSIIPESVAGSVSAPEFDTIGAAVDMRFKTGTYLGLHADQLSSDVDRTIGVFRFETLPMVSSSTAQSLDFDERSVAVTLNQLLAEEWSGGLSYRFTSSELENRLTEVPTSVLASADDMDRSDLHQVGSCLLFNHASGLFARAEANWFSQHNTRRTTVGGASATVNLPGDDFLQVNLYGGWRLRRQRGDIMLGILNLSGGDYHLNPLNSQAELAHERVFVARLRLRF